MKLKAKRLSPQKAAKLIEWLDLCDSGTRWMRGKTLAQSWNKCERPAWLDYTIAKLKLHSHGGDSWSQHARDTEIDWGDYRKDVAACRKLRKQWPWRRIEQMAIRALKAIESAS